MNKLLLQPLLPAGRQVVGYDVALREDEIQLKQL